MRPAALLVLAFFALAGAGVLPAHAQAGADAPLQGRGDRALVFRHGVRPSDGAPARPAPSRMHDASPGTVLSDTLLNDTAPRDPWLAFDKAQHVAFSMLSTLSAQYALVNKLGMGEGGALPISVAASAAVGIAKEVYDARSAHGTPSRRDLAADAVGILLATGLILL